MEKNKVKIEKVTVYGPPFNGQSFVPTNVNFLFGKNGAGKSTISRAIRDNTGISWINDSENGTTVQVFNDEYIKKNIDGEMDGVFTISEPDIETEKEIKNTESEQEKNTAEIQKQKEFLTRYKDSNDELNASAYETCWAITRTLIKQLKHNPTSGRKEAFFNQVVPVKAVEHPMEEILKLEKLVYSDNKKHIMPYADFEFPN